jgi:hypothetical protein
MATNRPARRRGRVAHDHLSCHVAQDAAAEPDDPLEAIHDSGEDAAAPHHERQREPDADDDEEHFPAGSAGHREHVVEAP